MMRSFFPQSGKWLKGNVHSHTTRTDGTCPPEKQIADYCRMGYDFLAITDHNVIDSFQLAEDSDICMIPGWERDIRHAPDNSSCIHVVGLLGSDAQATSFFETRKLEVNEIPDQQLIDSMHDAGQFTILAHPLWSRMTPMDVLALNNYDAIEVFNTGCECLMHSGHAEIYWDLLLQSGRRVLGIACDDTHGKTEKSDRFGGWIMVRCEERTSSSILSAMRKGNYYLSQGPEIFDWGIDENGHISLSCSPCEQIHVITYPSRGKSFFASDKPLTGITYSLKGNEKYIRIECQDSKGHTAWTNPHFFD